MTDYLRSPVLWVSLLILLTSVLINIEVMLAHDLNMFKVLYGSVLLFVGILGMATSVVLHSLAKRVRALEESNKSQVENLR